MISMPDNGVNGATAEWTRSQVDDFARLLVRLGLGTTRWLLGLILGMQSLADAGTAVNDPQALARFAADAINQAGRMADAIGRLRVEARHNAYIILGLDRISRNEPIDMKALQALLNEHEPFFNSMDFQRVVARGSRMVCAIGLGDPVRDIVGTGFLIGPDLVMTNHHAVELFVDVHPDRSLTPKSTTGAIYCYFDYFAGPKPPVPPAAPPHRHPSVAVPCAAAWLVHGRPLLENDGEDTAPVDAQNKYDYAVLRLSRPIGRLAARSSDGAPRGWFSLPQQIDTGALKKRVIVFQHPNHSSQQLDVGTYEQLDPSQTRVWYDASTFKGSSGGAAIDSDGELFALHNAAVTRTGLSKKLNQGVRIDLITDDLSATAPSCIVAPPNEDPLVFWSLTDDAADPQPALGRMTLRNHVAEMMAPSGTRVLVVTGPAASGVRFTKKLLRRMVGAIPIVEFAATSLATITPADFVRTIVDEIGVVGHNAGPVTESNSTENLPRWLRLDLPTWLSKALSSDPQQHAARYPAWIVINTITGPNERLLWADQLKELVAALAGVHDAGQRTVDQPQLRWLFLSRALAPLPISGIRRNEVDLTQETCAEEDFADCMAAAWRSIDKLAHSDRTMLIALGRSIVSIAPGGSVPRETLARAVREAMLKGAGGL